MKVKPVYFLSLVFVLSSCGDGIQYNKNPGSSSAITSNTGTVQAASSANYRATILSAPNGIQGNLQSNRYRLSDPLLQVPSEAAASGSKGQAPRSK